MGRIKDKFVASGGRKSNSGGADSFTGRKNDRSHLNFKANKKPGRSAAESGNWNGPGGNRFFRNDNNRSQPNRKMRRAAGQISTTGQESTSGDSGPSFLAKPNDRSQSNHETNINVGKNSNQGGSFFFKNKDRTDLNFKMNASSNTPDSFFIKNKEPLVSAANFTLRTNDNSDVANNFRPDKKPFDKKRFRMQKYSNKFKVEQWEEKKKKAILRGYYKDIKDDGAKFDVAKIYNEVKDEDCDNPGSNSATNIETKAEPSAHTAKKGKAFTKAHQELERLKEEKQKQKEEYLKRKAEKAEALKSYKKNKVDKFKRLNKKTKKGQPIMKDRIEFLLQKIQNSMES